MPIASVISKLKFYGEQAEANHNYIDALGYFRQWLVLDPQNPEAMLETARAYLYPKYYYESFELYKDILLIPNLTPNQKVDADAGFQSAFQYTFCNFLGLKRLKWADEIQNEYQSLLPEPASNSITCGLQ